MLKLNILPDGNLQIIADKDAHEEKKKILSMSSINAMIYLMEDHICNGWGLVSPETIGAMTSSPILCDDFIIEDDGTENPQGNIWWFPEYETTNEIEKMFTKEGAIFTKANDNSN